MNEKKYLFYLDILGFEALAREIAEKTGFEEDVIRQNYLSDPLTKKIGELKREGIQISKGISEIEGSDNYVLIVDHIQTAFELVGKLTTIRIPHKDYKFIPLEVALGTKEIDEDIEVKPINRKEIIKFLKSDIINPYRSHYKTKHGEGIKETFVLFTPDFFDLLEPLDRKYCEQISYKTNTFFVANVDKVQRRGRVFEFLEKIGHTGSKWYGRIDEVYVPPLEYEDMARTLKEKRIVFITGTPEYGKTFTAVMLMWEYYNSGYEPRWIKGGELTERIKVRERLENISAELKPRHILYFEDPFGRTKYERREGLEREIGTIIDSVKQFEDIYVIITSREEVFKEFEKEKISAKELKEFEKKLNIKKPSYDAEKRKEILLMWAEAENCKWLGNKELKELVLEAIKDKKILPTPLSMKDFAVATFDIEKESELKEKIEEKSKETAKAFADEIKNMTDDKILFLSFPFISSLPYPYFSYFAVYFVRTMYEVLVKELNLTNAWKFDRVFKWFEGDKIIIDEGCISFSHPSYSEAFEFILVEDGYITRINKEIFSKVLLKLSKSSEAVAYVLKVVADNFDKLPDDVRNLLFKLSEKDETAKWVALAVAGNFNKLPEGIRGLLFKLSGKDDIAKDVAIAITHYFDELPEDVRNKLLMKLSEKDMAVEYVSLVVAENFDKLPEDVRNLLFRFSENDEAAGHVSRAIAIYFNKLPDDVRNLLFKLSEKDDRTAWNVARDVRTYFDMLSEGVRNELLLKFSEKDKFALFVACIVADNFDTLSDDVRNELLLKLSENDKAAGKVAFVIARNYNKLPDDVKNLLFKLSEKDEAAKDVVWVVADNFGKLPKDVRNLLFKLSERDETAGEVAWAIADNFDKLPENVRILLDRLQKPLQQVIEDLIKDEVWETKEDALDLISEALPKINSDFVLKILNELSECEDETVRIKAAKMLKDIFGDSEAKKEY
jgi:Mg/Co/Ni transporter MgtE